MSVMLAVLSRESLTISTRKGYERPARRWMDARTDLRSPDLTRASMIGVCLLLTKSLMPLGEWMMNSYFPDWDAKTEPDHRMAKRLALSFLCGLLGPKSCLMMVSILEKTRREELKRRPSLK